MPMLAKRRAWLSAKRASPARVLSAGFLAQQNLLNKRLLFDEAKQTVLFARSLLQQ